MTEHDNQSVKRVSKLEETLAFQLTTAGIAYEREYQFDPKRKWRVDFRILGTNLLVEINGGTWMVKSGHSTGKGIERDYEKSNAAQLLGFTYLQYTKKEIDNLVALDTIREYQQTHFIVEVNK